MIRLEALDWLRAVTLVTPRAQVNALVTWMVESEWGPTGITDDDEVLTSDDPVGLLIRWTAIGSNDGWPKEAVNNCQALRILIAACRADEVQTSAYEVWLHCLTSANAENFSWASARKLQEILDDQP